jgi:hypothetical protein
MSDQEIENEIQAKGLTAPRITPNDVEATIASEYYFTADDGRFANTGVVSPMGSPLRTLTFCVLVLRNGFTVTGESAFASPKNFDAEIGKILARQKAVEKVRLLEGYRQRQHESGN